MGGIFTEYFGNFSILTSKFYKLKLETVSSYLYECYFGGMLDRNATHNGLTSQNTNFLVVSNEFLKDIQQLNGFEINVAHGGKINITVNRK